MCQKGNSIEEAFIAGDLRVLPCRKINAKSSAIDFVSVG